jgi:hypothetical protein
MKDMLSEEELKLVDKVTILLEDYIAAIDKKDERKIKLIAGKFRKAYRDL